VEESVKRTQYMGSNHATYRIGARNGEDECCRKVCTAACRRTSGVRTLPVIIEGLSENALPMSYRDGVTSYGALRIPR